MKKIFITLLIIVIGLGIYFFIVKNNSQEKEGQKNANTLQNSEKIKEAIKEVSEIALSREYKNDKYKFSINYPATLEVNSFDDENGTTILFQGYGSALGVQIYISPFDEPASTITKERIEEDADLTILESQPLEVGSSGKGLAFISKDTDGKEMRQVWFAFKNNLYQITTYKELDATLQKMMGTWKFF